MLPPGIFALGFSAETSLELDATGDTAALVHALAGFARDTKVTHGSNVVVGIRPTLVDPSLPDFTAMHGDDGFELPATQHDAWVWLTAASSSTVFDDTARLLDAVGNDGRVAAQVDGWGYRESRDLTGFEDGTENPTVAEAMSLLPIPEGRPGAGGTCLLLQQWRHERTWLELDQRRQEDVIGRSKPASIEIPEAQMPDDAHVPRTTVEIDGEERDIFRRNTPYGSYTDHGTLFIGFSPDFERMTRMLQQMLGTGPDGGPRDALTRYTTPLTGAHYLVPSVEDLVSRL